DKVLHVYNWSDYIGRTTIADFEAQTGIKVSYDTYDSNEVLETKLLTGRTGYDVVFPSGNFMQRQIRAGVFLKLDKSKLPNLSNMDPDIMRRVAANDPGNDYAINYTWGTTGIGFNPAMVRNVLGTDRIDSWAAVFDPAIASKLAKCGISMLDAPEDVIGSARIFQGRDPNSESPADLSASEELLTSVRPYVRYFHSFQQVNDLASGEICVALSWNGHVLQARARGAAAANPVEVAYVVPIEGAYLWFDMAAIPADAPHPENAHAFLNFLMDPQVIANISNDIGYANGNAASLPFVRDQLRNDPAVFPPDGIRAKLHPTVEFTPAYSRELNRAWTRIKTGQ
ncbi:MAG: polyamine ABC transporter substrate-binding protein, partial [Tepidisphaeraceae bacterium]